ncbi:hypothetical protein Tharo_3138 [Thauera aromatica K172]|uniref:Uncharacterized protein n=1 Tax=Thauera aromatica K172 TaxID=44139 RepID=A0A2R4BRQ6_THAAR|nr:hypothetical protein Tharo_3138 [Thauera aromatica K172]
MTRRGPVAGPRRQRGIAPRVRCAYRAAFSASDRIGDEMILPRPCFPFPVVPPAAGCAVSAPARPPGGGCPPAPERRLRSGRRDVR